jgi:hypothetical protein
MRSRRPVQQVLAFRTHGGARPGAGRKKDPARRLLPHTKRPVVTEATPVHVTLRVRPEVYSLRSRRSFRVIERALLAAGRWGDARVVHYSVQGNHVHLVAEAASRRVLARRVQGLEVRIARGMNRVMKRRGPVFADRYHARPLSTPLEVRRAIEYVLKNHRHHFGDHAARFDPCSSAAWFDGWRSPPARGDGPQPLVRPPKSWLLRIGWRRHGLLEP